MPGYIGFRPQFNPISLQEYLTVPMMIYEGRQKEADKIEQYQNEAEKWRSLMGDSPEAKAVWANYDSALEALGDDIMANKAGDIARGAKKLSNAYRGIKYKAEEAYEKQKKYQDILDKNPNLIGNAGTLMDYYGKDYTPKFIDSKDLATTIGSIVAPEAAVRPDRMGYTQEGINVYFTGIPEEELVGDIAKAIQNKPDSNISTGIRSYLDRIDYDKLTPDLQQKVKDNIYKSALANSGAGKNTIDPLKRQQMKAAIAGTYADIEYKKTQTKGIKQNLASEWNNINEFADTDTTSKRYMYRKSKDNNNVIHIERSPMTKKNGKWVQTDANYWEPAPSYILDGETYNEILPGTGIYGYVKQNTATENNEPEYINYTTYSKSGESQQHSSTDVSQELRGNKINYEDLPEDVQKKIVNNNTTTNTRSNFNASEYDIYQSIDSKGKPIYHVYKKNPKNKSTSTTTTTTEPNGRY